MKPGHWSVAAFAGSTYAWTLFVWSRLGAPQSFAAWRHVSSEDAAFSPLRVAQSLFVAGIVLAGLESWVRCASLPRWKRIAATLARAGRGCRSLRDDRRAAVGSRHASAARMRSVDEFVFMKWALSFVERCFRPPLSRCVSGAFYGFECAL